jgi:hypothetical protein
MKTKSLKNGLALKKKTIANLNTDDMNNIKGGEAKTDTETCCCYTVGSCGSCYTSLNPRTTCNTEDSWCI